MPRPHARFLSLLAFLLILGLPAGAFAAGSVTGRLVDPEGRPVRGALVLLVSGQAVAASTHTLADGTFALTPAAEGPFVIRVSSTGFRADPLTVAVTGRDVDLGTVQLQLSAITESLVVSAAQVEVPLSATASAVTVLTGEELRAQQYETVVDALRSVPGVTVASSGGRGALTSVYPRGGESDYSLIFVDGVQANSFGGGFDFAHLPVTNIDRVEIVRGPQSALYGANAIGSVIRVVTRRGGPPSVEGSIEGGSFDTLRLSGATAGSSGPWGWGLSGERLTTDGMNGALTAGGATVVNDQYNRTGAAAGGAWRSPGGATLRGDLRFSEDERGAPGPFGTDPGGTFFGINERAFATNDRLLGSLGTTVPLGGATRAQALVSHARTDGVFTDFLSGEPFPSDTWSRRSTARLQVDRTARQNLEVTAGGELLRERAGSTFIESNAGEVPVERSLAGLFGEARWSHDSRVFVTGGVRVERITRDSLAADETGFANRPAFDIDTVTSANPKVAASWYLRASGGDFTRVRASAGTGIRPPDAFEIAFTDNPGLKPERSRSTDVGFDQALAGGRLLLESTAFFNSFDDLIVAVGSFRESSRYRTDNISNARARGLELAGSAHGRAAGGHLQVRVAYTLLDTEILLADRAQSAPSPFLAGDPLLRRPKHQVGIDMNAVSGPFTTFVRGGGRTAVRDVDPSLGTFGGFYQAAGYTSWDAGVSWAALAPAEVLVRVTNIFDRRYEETLGYPSPGRGVYVGLRIAPRR